ncbi:MAG TPA: hypothetical protein VKY24_00740 [Reyranella sp.]|nr:hypothetical protein [Reyranella sp.]
MSDAPKPPELTIVLELEPPLSATIVKLARDYRETPRQAAHRLLFAALVAREGLAMFVEAIELLAPHEDDDEEPGR